MDTSKDRHVLVTGGSGFIGRAVAKLLQRTGKVGADPPKVGRVADDASSAMDCGHGSDDIHRLDLRSPEAARSGSEGSASANAAGDRRIQEECSH